MRAIISVKNGLWFSFNARNSYDAFTNGDGAAAIPYSIPWLSTKWTPVKKIEMIAGQVTFIENTKITFYGFY